MAEDKRRCIAWEVCVADDCECKVEHPYYTECCDQVCNKHGGLPGALCVKVEATPEEIVNVAMDSLKDLFSNKEADLRTAGNAAVAYCRQNIVHLEKDFMLELMENIFNAKEPLQEVAPAWVKMYEKNKEEKDDKEKD